MERTETGGKSGEEKRGVGGIREVKVNVWRLI